MARLFDLHIHTTKGSADSSLAPEDLILEAERLCLRGLCITEHSGPWDQSGFYKAEELCHTAKSVGGFVISAHPFRGVLGKHMRERPYLYRTIPDPIPQTPEQALDHPIFNMANAIEVANGGTADEENTFAMKVAGLLSIPVTGGSDAHSVHGIGKFVTAFRDEIDNEEQFLKALHERTFYPAVGLREGRLRPYGV